MAEYNEFYWCDTCANYVRDDCCDCCDGTDENHECYERKPMPTNADRIRAMSDEELAEWCADRNIVKCPTGWDSERCAVHSVCRECWLDWLKAEVET